MFQIGRPIGGSISIDPGATVLALGQFLSALAVVLLAAAVAVNRERAEQVLVLVVLVEQGVVSVDEAVDGKISATRDIQGQVRDATQKLHHLTCPDCLKD